MTYLWAFLASCIAVGLETYLRKHAQSSYLALMPYVAVPAIALNYLLFKLQQAGPNLLTAFVIFSFCNIILRIGVVNYVLKDQIGVGTWVALGLVALAQLVKVLL